MPTVAPGRRNAFAIGARFPRVTATGVLAHRLRGARVVVCLLPAGDGVHRGAVGAHLAEM